MKSKIIRIVITAVFLVCISGCQTTLTDKEILKIANEQAKAEGLTPKEYKVYYDKGNVESGGKMAYVGDYSGVAERFGFLKGRDYQAVVYKPRNRRSKASVYTFLIDKKTGQVIAVLKRK